MDKNNHCKSAPSAAEDYHVFVPQEFIEAFNNVYHSMQEAQQRLRQVAESLNHDS